MIEPTQQPLSITYYVVFTQGSTHWISRWCKPNFSHIYLITHDEYNWILLNPTRLYLQVMIPPMGLEDDFPTTVIKPDDSALKITFGQRDDTQQYGSYGMLNCVTWAKYMLGLRIKVLTPWRLFSRLVNFNAEDMLQHGIISIERVKG